MKKVIFTPLSHRYLTQTSLVGLVNLVELNVNGLSEQEWKNDEAFMKLWNNLLWLRTYFSSLLQRVLSSNDTKLHAEAQQVVIRAISALKRAVNVYAVSEVLAEREACKQILKLFKVVETEVQKNSTTQSSNQSRLLLKLRNSENAPLVNLLQLEAFVNRLQLALSSYDNLVQASNSDRIVAKKDNENVDRQQVMESYNLVLGYVQAMVVIDKYPFMQVFLAIDEARIKYSTDIQTRITRAENLKVEAQKKLEESKSDEGDSQSVA